MLSATLPRKNQWEAVGWEQGVPRAAVLWQQELEHQPHHLFGEQAWPCLWQLLSGKMIPSPWFKLLSAVLCFKWLPGACCASEPGGG